MMDKIFASILCVLLLSCGLTIAIAYNPNNSKEVEETAAAPVIIPSQYDTSALETWHNDSYGNIRMIAGWYVQPDTIETEDGNWWSLNTESINPNECLLIWFDDKGTPEITDDEIIKVWSEVYD